MSITILNSFGPVEIDRWGKINIVNRPITTENVTELFRNIVTQGLEKNIKTLILTNTRVTHLPPEVGLCTNLFCLFVCYSPFKEVPQFIGRLRNLEFIDFSRTHLRTIPLFVRALPKLQTLSHSHLPKL